MLPTLRVGTRKGLFTFTRTAPGQWQADESVDFLAEPVSMLLRDPRDGYLYAALNLGHFGVKLHRRTPANDWEEIQAPKFPSQEDKDGPTLELLWELVPGGTDQPGKLWAGTIPGGLFVSEDRGNSWTLNESLWNRPEREQWFGGGYDQPGIHSICVHPKDSQNIRLAISCGGVWESVDGGEQWNLIGEGMRAAYMPPEQADALESQDPHRMVSCPSAPEKLWIQHHNGIFHSDNGGRQWQEITTAAPSNFGFAVAVHPNDPDKAWFIPAVKDESRVPVDSKLVVMQTTDGGKSFHSQDNGLPDCPSYDLVYRHSLDIDSSGSILAFGSTTGNLWVSEDEGDQWQCISNYLPPIYVVKLD